MPKVKWAGRINHPAEFQKGELPEHAVKLKMPTSTASLMVRALPFAIVPFLILAVSIFLKTYLAKQSVINPRYLPLGIGIGLILLFAHEWLHAVVYPKDATVHIGFYPKAFAVMALSSHPMKRARFVFMCLLPLVLGIVPLIAFWFTPYHTGIMNGVLFGIAVMGFISPYPDIYNCYQVIKQTPAHCSVQFYMDDLYYFT